MLAFFFAIWKIKNHDLEFWNILGKSERIAGRGGRVVEGATLER